MAVGKDSAYPPADVAEYSRLHISPLNPTLLTTILPASIRPNARNISYHSLETFPEKPYGFVELPAIDAEKIKKILNGSILRGTKLRIEEARPAKQLPGVGHMGDAESPRREKEDTSKKRKRDHNIIPGAELRDRNVKRGWTTPSATLNKSGKRPKDKKGVVVKSKYTTGPECLFKVVLPPNVAVNQSASSSDVKPEKSKRTKAEKDIVIHEFSKTTKHATFLRGSAGSAKTKGPSEFVEGKGWVDEEGNVVEEIAVRAHRDIAAQIQDSSSAVSDASEDESSSSEEDPSHMDIDEGSRVIAKEDSLTSSSGSSADEEGEEDEESTSNSESSSDEEPQLKETTITSGQQSSAGPPLGLSITIPDTTIMAASKTTEVHPLEALFKRARLDANAPPVPKVAAPPFSFFDADADEEMEAESEANTQVPLTPFTQQDFEYRGMRSAAPTPDTAYPNKRFVWPTDNDYEEDEDEAQEYESPPTRKEQTTNAEAAEAPVTDFQKWFYEHRGETNRAWKKRRKLAAKDKRQRENRKRENRAT